MGELCPHPNKPGSVFVEDFSKDENGVPLNAICTNCGHSNGEHAGLGDWCPKRGGGWGEYSKTRKFSQAPKEQKKLKAKLKSRVGQEVKVGAETREIIADTMRIIAGWIEEDSEDWTREEVVGQANLLRRLSNMLTGEGE